MLEVVERARSIIARLVRKQLLAGNQCVQAPALALYDFNVEDCESEFDDGGWRTSKQVVYLHHFFRTEVLCNYFVGVICGEVLSLCSGIGGYT